MMTEAEFKLHMSVYLDNQMKPLRYEMKLLEKRLNRLESLVKGDISPAFPFSKQLSSLPNSNQQFTDVPEDERENGNANGFVEEYLKPIHENVLAIKSFIDEYRITTEERRIQNLEP